MLTFAISPCPNDTFAFHRLVEDGAYDVVLDDVESLNRAAEGGTYDVTKISVAAYGRIRDTYALLRAGGAAGFGVGPLLVARRPGAPGARIAIPGTRTTAALLLRRLGIFETVSMRFDRIGGAVLRGDVDAGVLIHEGRFTYADQGLVKLADLGELWNGPIPLGAVAIRRDLGPDAARAVDAAIRASVEHARAHPAASAAFVAEHAQELASDVVRRHIDHYVNHYTLAIDEQAVARLLAFGESEGFFPPSDSPLFAY